MESRVFVWGSGYSADLWIRVPKATGRERKGKLLGALRAPPAWDGEPESQDTAVRLSLQREESWRWRSKRMPGGRELPAPRASANCAPTTPKDLGPGTVLGGAVRARSCVWMTPARRHLATYPRSYRAPQKLLR